MTVPAPSHARGHWQRKRLITYFGIGFGLGNIAFAPVFLLFNQLAAALYIMVAGTAMALSPVVLQRTGSLAQSAHVLIGSMVALCGGVSVLLGGLSAPATPLLLIAPVVASYLVDRRAAFVWSLLVAGLLVLLFVLHLFHVLPTPALPTWFLRTLQLAGLLAGIAATLLFVAQHNAEVQAGQADTQTAREQLATLIAHFDELSATLSHAASQFFGDNSVLATADEELWHELGALGLAQRIRDKSQISRNLISTVSVSVRGAVTQNKQISELINALHREVIAMGTLMADIDKISDRLDLAALNLGIEAAHVGQIGKSFVLMADDMRRLGERVSSTSNRIKAAIRELVSHAQTAIDVSGFGRALTESAATKLDIMENELGQVYRLVDETAALTHHMCDAVIARLSAIHGIAAVVTPIPAQETATPVAETKAGEVPPAEAEPEASEASLAGAEPEPDVPSGGEQKSGQTAGEA